jgi:hypothetical protein
MYLGQQKIVKTVKDGDNVKITLEALEIDNLASDTEEISMLETTFDKIKTDEPNIDATQLRFDRCTEVIEELVMSLIKHNVRHDDMNHIFQSVADTIRVHKEQLENEFYGNHQTKRTINQYIK